LLGTLVESTPAPNLVHRRHGRVGALVRVWAALFAIMSSPAIAQEGGETPGAITAETPSEAESNPEDGDARSPTAAAGLETEAQDENQGAAENERKAFEILSHRIEPGTRERLFLRITESFVGALIETPIFVAAGREPGTTLCVVAGVHGDEINGVEIVRRMMLTLDEENLRGNVIAVPIANLAAFRRGSRYLPDRRDLNRFFPGRAFGSSASRIAHGLFSEVIARCDLLVDLHTGSFHRTNLHQLRADLTDDATQTLAHNYNAEVIVNSPGRPGTLRRAATDIGIPAITVEAGQPSRFDLAQVEEALEGLDRLLAARGMLMGDSLRATRPPPTAYLRTSWVRCDQGGILVSQVELGDEVESGQVLGTISDPLSGAIESIVTPFSGRVIGMALDQLVMPGFAAYHVGLNPRQLGAAPETVIQSTIGPETQDDDPEGLELEERPE
jgi:predicted deacylase